MDDWKPRWDTRDIDVACRSGDTSRGYVNMRPEDREIELRSRIVRSYRMPCTCVGQCVDRPMGAQSQGEHNAPEWLYKMVTDLLRRCRSLDDGGYALVCSAVRWCETDPRGPEPHSNVLQATIRLSKGNLQTLNNVIAILYAEGMHAGGVQLQAGEVLE